MYKIAVCEDDPVMLKNTAALAEQALNEMSIEGAVTPFSEGNGILEAFENERDAFDLLLLDILMDGINGMELAKTLRRRGVSAGIAFITSSKEFLREGYSVQPINYLFKPAEIDGLKEVIQADRRIHIGTQTAIIQHGTSTLVLDIADIIYIEVFQHQVVIHTTRGEKNIWGTLKGMMDYLPSDIFVRCHNSYLVNLNYVSELTRACVLLRGGAEVPISRKYYQLMQTALINYLA